VTAEGSAELQPLSDAVLIEKVMQRDESALAALYDRYAAMLSAVLNRILRDSQAAEELLQDIFLQLWRSTGQFDPSRGSLPAWLITIARNRAISRLRRRNPAAPGNEEFAEPVVALPLDLENAVAQQEIMERVKGAMAKLPEEQRAALELAYFEGLTHTEIAERTGNPLGTVKTRLRSALETLKRTLQMSAVPGISTQ
jgi:RNA polymerase sigma-70 factor, ECF subfamily